MCLLKLGSLKEQGVLKQVQQGVVGKAFRQAQCPEHVKLTRLLVLQSKFGGHDTETSSA